MNLLPEFKVGDSVTFCAYPDQMNSNLRAVVREVVFDHEYKRIFYRISGDAISYTTGQSLKESKLFIPFGVAFDMINERQLQIDSFKTDWVCDDRKYLFKFKNSNQQIEIDLNCRTVKLIGADHKIWQSVNYGDK